MVSGMSSARAVFEAVMAGDSGRALEHFYLLETPSACALHWAGVALLWERRFSEARSLLERAAQGGARGAHVHLAYLHRTQGFLDCAWSELNAWQQSCGQESLDSDLDGVYYHQQRAYLLFTQDRLSQATTALSEGWALSYRTPFGLRVRPVLALTHGVVLYTLGEHAGSLSWLEAALSGSESQRVYIYGWQALAYLQLGLVKEGRAALDSAERCPLAEVARPMHLYQRGVALRLLGESQAACESLTAACELAQAVGERETEVLALLARVGLLGERWGDSGAVALAGALIARAESLAHTGALKVLAAFRRVTLPAAGETGRFACQTPDLGSSQSPLEEGSSGLRFEELALKLGEVERWRDAAVAWLHSVEGWLKAGERTRAEGALAKVSNSLFALGGLDVRRELIGLPGVTRLLESRGWGLRGFESLRKAPARLELRVLGEGGVFVGGERLSLGYRHAAEFLHYILKNPGSSSSELALALRPDEPPRKTKVYLAGLAKSLSKSGSLKIVNDSLHGLSLDRLGRTLWVDAFELERLIGEGQVAQALSLYRPLLGISEWSVREAARLQRRMVNALVLELSACLERADGVLACHWAEAALALDPFEPTLNAYLLAAIEEAQGLGAARRRARELSQGFALEGLRSPIEISGYLN